MKNTRIFYLKIFIFLVVKFSIYSNRLVFVMNIKKTYGQRLTQSHRDTFTNLHGATTRIFLLNFGILEVNLIFFFTFMPRIFIEYGVSLKKSMGKVTRDASDGIPQTRCANSGGPYVLRVPVGQGFYLFFFLLVSLAPQSSTAL